MRRRKQAEKGMAFPLVIMVVLFIFMLTVALLNIYVYNQRYANKQYDLVQKRFLVREGFKVALAWLRDNSGVPITYNTLYSSGWATSSGVTINSGRYTLKVYIFPSDVLDYYKDTDVTKDGLPSNWDWKPWDHMPSGTSGVAPAPYLIISRVIDNRGKELWGIMVAIKEAFNQYMIFDDQVSGGGWYVSFADGALSKVRGRFGTNEGRVYIYVGPSGEFWSTLSENSPQSEFDKRWIFQNLEFTGPIQTDYCNSSSGNCPDTNGLVFASFGDPAPSQDWQWKAIVKDGLQGITSSTPKDIPEGQDAIKLAWGSDTDLPPSNQRGVWLNLGASEAKSGLYITEQDSEVNGIFFDVLDLGNNQRAQVITIRFDSNPPSPEWTFFEAHPNTKEINVIKVPAGATLNLSELQNLVNNYREYAINEMNVQPYLEINRPLNDMRVKVYTDSDITSNQINLLDLLSNANNGDDVTTITGPALVVISPSLNTAPSQNPIRVAVLQGEKFTPKPVIFADANVGRPSQGFGSSWGSWYYEWMYENERGWLTYGGVGGIYSENMMLVANPDEGYDIRIMSSLVPYGVRIPTPDEYDVNNGELPNGALPPESSDATLGLWAEKVFIGKNADTYDWGNFRQPTGVLSTPTGLWIYAAAFAANKQEDGSVTGTVEVEWASSIWLPSTLRYMHVVGSLIQATDPLVGWFFSGGSYAAGFATDWRYDERYAKGLAPFGFPTTGRYRVVYSNIVQKT